MDRAKPLAEPLTISRELALPLDAVTQKLGFMGRTGSGKTYGATKTAEEMLAAGAQVVALDPVGVWYGLRIGADGNPGYPIPVFGGLHGDIPLAATAGALIADLIVDRGISCVLDISQFETNADKARFGLAFAERFFFRKKSAPSAVHLFIEECQEFVPQNAQPGDTKMLGAFERLIKLGRNFGIGVSLISQRPQEVNKKALEQVECLFAFQMTGTRSRKAIEEWVSAHDVDEEVRLGELLPSLPIGAPYAWSPQWLKFAKRIKIAKKRTADVSATPTVGAATREQKPLAPVDLEQLRDAMADTIEQAKTDDPKELQKRIRELEREVRAAENAERAAAPGVDEAALQRRIDQAVYAEAQRHERYRNVLQQQTGAALAELRGIVPLLTDACDGVRLAIDAIVAVDVGIGEEWVKPIAPDPAPPVQHISEARSADPLLRLTKPAQRPPRSPTPSSGGPVGGTPLKLLNAIAFYESFGQAQPTKRAIAAFAGVSTTGGSWATWLSSLRTAGYIAEPSKDTIALTEAGRAVADTSDLPRTKRELHERWLSKVGGTPRDLLETLLGVYPDAMEKTALAAHVGVSTTGGSWSTWMSTLRTPGLIEDVSRSEVRASPNLFPKGLR